MLFIFYLFCFLKKKNLYNLVKDFFLNKKNYFLISLFFIYLFYLLNFWDPNVATEKDAHKYGDLIGLGYIYKISLILFEDHFLREIFTYFSFFVSWIIILIYIDRNFKDILILFYFLVLSLHLWPLMQEYFDPFILLISFTFWSSKLSASYKNSIILFLYLSTLLLSANIYYSYFPLYEVG